MIQVIKKLLNNKQDVFLTGGGGTGKSYLIRRLKEEYGTKMVVVSTTGLSALNIGGRTIHSYFKTGICDSIRCLSTFHPLLKYRDNTRTARQKKQEFIRPFKYLDILVIDECSMMSAEYLDMILTIITEMKTLDPSINFNIIFTGDLLQLPPVSGSPIYYHPFFQQAQMINLTKVYRTDNKPFAHMLSKIRLGIWDDKMAKYLLSLRPTTEPRGEKLVLVPTNQQASYINNIALKNLNEEIIDIPFTVTHTKGYSVNPQTVQNVMKSISLSTESLKIAKGARVIIKQNIFDSGVVNGDTGIVVDYDNSIFGQLSEITIKLDRNGQKVRITTQTLELNDYRIHTIPVVLAYAITIHSSQGQSIDSYVLDTENMFSPGHFYVGISRATNPHNLNIISDLQNLYNQITNINRGAYQFYINKINQNLAITEKNKGLFLTKGVLV